jgi:hypothetical protein
MMLTRLNIFRPETLTSSQAALTVFVTLLADFLLFFLITFFLYRYLGYFVYVVIFDETSQGDLVGKWSILIVFVLFFISLMNVSIGFFWLLFSDSARMRFMIKISIIGAIFLIASAVSISAIDSWLGG